MIKKHIFRPFSDKFKVLCRGYSRPLQRALTDFGADVSFAEAAAKMQEHYGIEVPPSMIEKFTLIHAQSIAKVVIKKSPEKASILIIEADGGMVPIVEIGKKMMRLQI